MKKFIFLIVIFILYGCAKTYFKSKWVKETAPETFITRFDTSKGLLQVILKGA